MINIPEESQRAVEFRYARKHVDKAICVAIDENADMQLKIDHGVSLLREWLSYEYFPSKNARLAQIKPLDLKLLVTQIFTGIAYVIDPTLFVSVTAQLASRLNFDDKRESIETVAEIIAVLSHTDAFDVGKAHKYASVLVLSRIPLNDSTMEAIRNTVYMPPMICAPAQVESNYQSGYLTFNDSLILGGSNSHDMDICLDVINTQNAIPLSLSLELLDTVKEIPKTTPATPQEQSNWDNFMAQSLEIYKLMVSKGNRFWLTNKPDTRGRLYAQGYHINPQGASYKKAMIELADKEVVQGVPV